MKTALPMAMVYLQKCLCNVYVSLTSVNCASLRIVRMPNAKFSNKNLKLPNAFYEMNQYIEYI